MRSAKNQNSIGLTVVSEFSDDRHRKKVILRNIALFSNFVKSYDSITQSSQISSNTMRTVIGRIHNQVFHKLRNPIGLTVLSEF